MIKVTKKLLMISFLFFSALIHAETPYSISIFTASKDFSTLSSGKAKILFQGKIKRLDRKSYSLVDWPPGSKTKKDFYKTLINQSEARVNATRAKLIFSGKGFPPKEIKENNYKTLEKYLRAHKNSIGYAPSSEISKDLTILFTIQVGK